MKINNNTQFRYTPDIGVVPAGEKVHCGVCGKLIPEISLPEASPEEPLPNYLIPTFLVIVAF